MNGRESSVNANNDVVKRLDSPVNLVNVHARSWPNEKR
jgi:hypothetical protein